MRGSWPRWLNLVVGLWLVASVFLWRHESDTGYDTVIAGGMIAASAVLALWNPPFRWAAFAAGVWVLGSAVTFRHAIGLSVVHDALLGVAAIVLSALPSRPRLWRPRRQVA